MNKETLQKELNELIDQLNEEQIHSFPTDRKSVCRERV